MRFRGRGVQAKKVRKTPGRKRKKRKLRREAALSAVTGQLATAQAFRAPTYECWEPAGLFGRNNGLGPVMVTRKTPGHQILVAIFFVDVFCLGVKDALCGLMDEAEYRLKLEFMGGSEKFKSLLPACARKLVEGAEAYARELGFGPQKNYEFAKRIFGDIDTQACSRSFNFGLDGKPFYMAAPTDSPGFSRHVMETLRAKLGSEGFAYQVPLSGKGFGDSKG